LAAHKPAGRDRSRPVGRVELSTTSTGSTFKVTKLIDWWTVAFHERIAYVYNNYSGALSTGFEIVDFRNPQTPQLLTEYSALGVVDIAFTGDRAIVAGEIEPFVSGLMVMNMADPLRPTIEDKIYTPRTHTISDIINGITLIKTKVLIFLEPEMEIVDISDPAKPQQEYLGDSLTSDARFGHAIAFRDNYAMVAGGMNLGIWQMRP
jgi:hypothetical protein